MPAAARASDESFVISLPSSVILPALGFITPVMLRSVLVQLEQDLSNHISSDSFLSQLVEYLRSLDMQPSTNQNAYRHDTIRTSAKGSAP